MKRFLLTLVFLLLSSFFLLALLFAPLFLPVSPSSQTVEVKVERGESFASITRKLKDKYIIGNEKIFFLWAWLSGSEKKIQWGLYRFDLLLSPKEVLDRMVLGKGVLHRITIAEGLTVTQIAELLEEADVAEKAKFLAEAKSPDLLSRLGLEGTGIEGYLFPDTYYFPPFISEREILTAMTSQFRTVLSPAMEAQANALGLSLHEVLTLASLIEKETGMEAERPLISAVFHNRLRRHIPLQSDPSAIYGLKRFSGTLTRKDLQNNNPYNTYLIRGLPPGPICNPSLSSLKAALDPAEVPYLYFVSKNDGSHLFSVSLEDHNRAVKIYQTERRGRPQP